jgi:hypothetical protein
MAGHAWRWVLVSILLLGACGRSNSTDDPTLGGQPATGGSASNAGSTGEGGDSRSDSGEAGAGAGGTMGRAHGGAPAPADGGAAEAGAATSSGGASSGGASSGGASSGGASSGGTQSEGGSTAGLPVAYDTCCYIGGNVRVFVTKFDPNTRLCINVSFIQQLSTQPMGMESEISLPEGFLLERALATSLEPEQSCSRQLRTQNSREASSARGTVSFNELADCHETGVSGELIFTFAGIDGEQTLRFDDHEPSCI